MTAFLGAFSSVYITYISQGQQWNNLFLWITLSLLFMVIIYYTWFSTYAMQILEKKNQAIRGKTELTKTYLTLAKQNMKQGNIDSHNKASYIYKDTLEHITFINGDDNE